MITLVNLQSTFSFYFPQGEEVIYVGYTTANGGQYDANSHGNSQAARDAADLSHFSDAGGQYSYNGHVFSSERDLEAYKIAKGRGEAL